MSDSETSVHDCEYGFVDNSHTNVYKRSSCVRAMNAVQVSLTLVAVVLAGLAMYITIDKGYSTNEVISIILSILQLIGGSVFNISYITQLIVIIRQGTTGTLSNKAVAALTLASLLVEIALIGLYARDPTILMLLISNTISMICLLIQQSLFVLFKN